MDLEELWKEDELRVRHLEKHRPNEIDGVGISRSKLPFKALWYRESLLWRTVELGVSALDALKADRLASGIPLIRGIVENTAALWYLHDKSTETIRKRAVADVDAI